MNKEEKAKSKKTEPKSDEKKKPLHHRFKRTKKVATEKEIKEVIEKAEEVEEIPKEEQSEPIAIQSEANIETENTDSAEEESEEDASNEAIAEPAKKQKLPFFTRIKNFFKNPEKRLVFLSSVGIVIIGLFSLGIYFTSRNIQEAPQKATIENTAVKKEEPTLFESPLDGVMTTDEASTKKHPLAIVVENHPDARPQSGLSQASVVYEALAEGGITRFLGIFGENEAEKVGPVRSARTYFVDYAHGYDAYLAHVGGNMDALDKIPADKVMDLDQFKYSSPYWRETATGLALEHTMYTSTTKLREQAVKNKYSEANNYSVYNFKADPDKVTLPESQKVTIDYSNPSFKVQFVYNKETNSYDRILAGKAHVDRTTKNQLSPKNVIVMTVKSEPTITRINEPGLTMSTIGEGKASIFIDGKEIKGTWKKQSSETREMFFDQSGNEITFNRGQFWICVVPPSVTTTVE